MAKQARNTDRERLRLAAQQEAEDSGEDVEMILDDMIAELESAEGTPSIIERMERGGMWR